MSIWEKITKAVSRYVPVAPKTQTNPNLIEDWGFSGGNWQNILYDMLQKNAEDGQLYRDYDEMDTDVPEIAMALDVMTDFVVYPNHVDRSDVFEVRSSKYQDIIDKVNKVIKPQQDLYAMIRDAIKYGDNFEEILRTKDYTPIGFKNIPIETTLVNMNNGMVNPERYLTQINTVTKKEITTLKSDEVFHLCMKTDRRRHGQTGKGTSKLQKARLIYRQVRLMEEGAIIKRLSKANNNIALMIDVGDLTGDDALDYIEKYRKRISRRKYIDPSTGKFSYKTNPMSVLEDLFLPTRQGSNAGAQVLNQGSSSDHNMTDVEYFQNKMIYATGVPKLLIGKEQDVNSKSTSDMQFICFLRSIRRIQTCIEPTILAFYEQALRSFGVANPDDLTVHWPVIDTIDEERKWRIEQLKWGVATVLSKDLTLIDDYYMYKNFMGFTDDQIKEITTRIDEAEEKAMEEFGDVDFEDDPNAGTGEPDAEDPETEDPESEEDTNPDNPEKDQAKTAKERQNHVYTVLEKNCRHDKDRDALRSFIKLITTDSEASRLVQEVLELSKIKMGK